MEVNKTEEPTAAVTVQLLRNPDKVREWLTVADRHMQSYANNPEIFLLPKAHEFLNPLIRAFAHDLEDRKSVV